MTSAGLPVVSLVATCLGLSDFNPSIRADHHIARAKSVVDLATAFPTARNLCFVPGEYMFQRKLIPPALEWDLVIDATRQVGLHAAAKGLDLAIELLPFDFAFVNSIDAMERFLDAVGLDNVKATVDISHFWLQRIPPRDVATRLSGRVAHVHISDCDGVNHGDMPPGRGNTPFGDYLGAIRETGFGEQCPSSLNFPRILRPWWRGWRRRMRRRANSWKPPASGDVTRRPARRSPPAAVSTGEDQPRRVPRSRRRRSSPCHHRLESPFGHGRSGVRHRLRQHAAG